jgi:hypothetical protein
MDCRLQICHLKSDSSLKVRVRNEGTPECEWTQVSNGDGLSDLTGQKIRNVFRWW